MTRREFIRTAALSGAAASASLSLFCTGSPKRGLGDEIRLPYRQNRGTCAGLPIFLYIPLLET